MKPGEMIDICLSCCSFKPGSALSIVGIAEVFYKMDNYCSWAVLQNFSVETYHLVLG